MYKEIPDTGSYTVEITTHNSDSNSETHKEIIDFYNFIKETWSLNGVLHRRGGPAIVRRDINSGKTLSQEWFEHGQPHRLGGPAFIYEDDDLKIQEWFKKGKRHREDDPSFTYIWLDTGRVADEEWHHNGKLHRIGGPAQISRHSDSGIVTYERWYKEGVLHRDHDKPAVICRSEEDGLTFKETWYQNGKLHRLEGPAEVSRDGKYGEKIRFEYYCKAP